MLRAPGILALQMHLSFPLYFSSMRFLIPADGPHSAWKYLRPPMLIGKA
jgi:hypothetical protein